MALSSQPAPAGSVLGQDQALPWLAEGSTMTDTDYARMIDEVDRLINDPDVPMEPGRVWSLLAEIARVDGSALSETL
jgi:hypothetical protein